MPILEGPTSLRTARLASLVVWLTRKGAPDLVLRPVVAVFDWSVEEDARRVRLARMDLLLREWREDQRAREARP